MLFAGFNCKVTLLQNNYIKQLYLMPGYHGDPGFNEKIAVK